MHQAGIELARQAAAIAKRYALTIVPRPSRKWHTTLNCILYQMNVLKLYIKVRRKKKQYGWQNFTIA